MTPTAIVNAMNNIFKYKIASSIIVLACWPETDRVKLIQEFTKCGLSATFSCDLAVLDHVNPYRFQGVLTFQPSTISLNKVKTEHFSHWYKWVIVGNVTPNTLEGSRYDTDMVLIEDRQWKEKNGANSSLDLHKIFIKDVYKHPTDGILLFPWAFWSKADGLQLTHAREMILRRLNLNRYPLKIAAPMGYYSEGTYKGTFKDYVMDISTPERDPGIRSAYGASALIVEALNATEVVIGTQLWSTEVNNSSMILMVSGGAAELGGGVLRILHDRITRLDYAMPIWPFSVGFTYVAERESSNNMFAEPFTASVWWSCLGLVALLAMAQRLMARKPEEKEGAYIAVLASYLQQDASAVPEGVSGRLTFMVLSISSMLIHAYYTSAIVSALMSTGRSGPDSLTTLADSRYDITSEDYDYMRYLMFDLIQEGSTAYHTEYNQLYPRMKTFTDDQICKLQYVDTIPESMTWVTTTKRGQWLEVFRAKGSWLHETGLARRLVTRLKLQPPPCRAALLAERVKFGDVLPAIILYIVGIMSSLIQLGVEILLSRCKKTGKKIYSTTTELNARNIEVDYFEEIDQIYY